MENFHLYSRYYDLLYATKDYQLEAQYVYNALQLFNKNIFSILELGSGTGNHAKHLCAQGLQVYGIERSDEMVKAAKNKGIQNYYPEVADITSFQLQQKFDAAISLFHVISYLTDKEQLTSCFTRIREHLNDNGIFLFDVWYTPAVYVQKPETRIKRLQNEELEIIRIAEPEVNYNENVINVHYEVIIHNKQSNLSETLIEKHPMRHFSIPEIDILASLTGFELIKAEEFLTGKQPGENTWGVCFILKKINA